VSAIFRKKLGYCRGTARRATRLQLRITIFEKDRNRQMILK